MNDFELLTSTGKEAYKIFVSRMKKEIQKPLDDDEIEQLFAEFDLGELSMKLDAHIEERRFGDILREQIDDTYFQVAYENRVRNEEELVACDVDDIQARIRADFLQQYIDAVRAEISEKLIEIAHGLHQRKSSTEVSNHPPH
jgi:broad specificity phosphatase PhoE